MMAVLLARRYLFTPYLSLRRIPYVFYIAVSNISYGLHIGTQVYTAIWRYGEDIAVWNITGESFYKILWIPKIGFKKPEL